MSDNQYRLRMPTVSDNVIMALEVEVKRLRAERDLRCESCDHLAKFHHDDGCWYTVTRGTLDKDLVCVCIVPRSVDAQPTEGAQPPDDYIRTAVNEFADLAERTEGAQP